MEVILRDNNIISLKRTKSETTEQYYERMWIFANNMSKYDLQHEKLITLTKIWSNIKYLRATYRNEIMKEIKELSQFQLSPGI